ncbi:MAG: acyl-CoA thioesterase [Myxococcales bacterium]|nr:acyl-CoA thioesterase [Myxococcales bacterium]MCB9536149.1 acyl-CoA thioesterase [Myxococcales bacterium]
MLTQRLRVARVFADALLQRRPTSRLARRVALVDCDLNRHMTNSRYPDYLDLGRWDLMLRSGAGLALLRARQKPVVVELNLRFRRELPYGAAFVLDSRLIALDGKAARFAQTFLVDDRVHAEATVTSLVLGGGRVVPPDVLAPFVVEPLHPEAPP